MRAIGLSFFLLVAGCPASPRCELGSTQACTCPEKTAGTQLCTADGTFGVCEPCKTLCGREDCAVTTVNATGRTCVAQVCEYASCLEGFADCDGKRANGCEYLGYSCPMLLASGQSEVIDLAVDQTSLYWTSRKADGGGTVMRLPVGGGTPVTLASAQLRPEGLVLGNGAAYWTDGNALKTVPLAGGAPVALASNQSFMGGTIAVDRAFVYWTVNQVDSAVRKVSLDGGVPIELATGRFPLYLAIDGTHVYWTDDFAVRRIPLAGGTAEDLAVSRSAVYQVVTDGVFVYWANYTTLLKTPVDGGASVSLTAAKPRGTIAVNGDFIYWAESDSILRVHVDGGAPRTVASAQSSPWAVAVDDTFVYWVGAYNDTIVKGRKAP